MELAAAHRPQPHLRPLVAVAAALGALVTLAVAGGVVPLPDVDGALEDASRTLGGWAYPAVAGFAFLETGAFIGLLVPGETAVVVGGVVAERGGVELVPLIGLVWLAAAGGDLVSFLLGRRLGRPFLHRHGERMRLGPERLARVERFYDRHGGKAVLVGRFAGIVRAISPFLAGASGLALRRFLPWSAAGALLWAATFTLVGYAFSESFAQSGESAARIGAAAALVAGLGFLAAGPLRSGGFGRGHDAGELQRRESAQGPQSGPDQRTRDDVEREVHAQIYARQRDSGRDRQGVGTQARAEDRDGGGGGERGGAVARGKGRVAGDGREGAEVGIGHGWALPVEELLEPVHHERGGATRGGGGSEGERQAAPAHVRAESEPDQQWPLDPPGGQQHEDRGQRRVLEGRSGFDEGMIEVDQGSHRQDRSEASTRGRLVVAVNGRASGVADPDEIGRDLVALLEELGAQADSVVTHSEPELWDLLRDAAASGRRVVLVGGDGSVHAAANAPLRRLPDLAIVPAGRANNVARALGIPTTRAAALAVAAHAPVRPLDALRVATPDRFVYAVEALSAGFQAEARAAYRADNSADLRQGLRALAAALRRYRPYGVAAEVDSSQLRSRDAAQLFFSNLPYFGFGFEVDPGADPADGHFEAILLEARSRRRLVRLLAAVRRGRHIGHRGVRRQTARRARLTQPLPLVADALPLGTTTATVSVEPARLRLAAA